MRYGIPLLENRVSPRCTIADSVLVVAAEEGRIDQHEKITLDSGQWTGLIKFLLNHQVDVLVAGGIDRETKQILSSYGLEVIDNVACSSQELLAALAEDKLRSGFGFHEQQEKSPSPQSSQTRIEENHADQSHDQPPWERQQGRLVRFDCLICDSRECLIGRTCLNGRDLVPRLSTREQTVLEVARDLSCEHDRRLCRVAELIYFCLGMSYSRLGVAYCVDLTEPAGILIGLLRRFFEVHSVCCKVGGTEVDDTLVEGKKAGEDAAISCNPLGQAAILNELKTDLNIIVGLCMGVDSLFTQASQAPVTTLFVKDKSLVNNPIGAIYSDYYLNELSKAQPPHKV